MPVLNNVINTSHQLPVVNCSFMDHKTGTCKRGYYGGRPSPGVCWKHCPEHHIQNADHIFYKRPSSPHPSQKPAGVEDTTTTIKQRPAWKIKWAEKLLGEGSIGLGDTVKYWIEIVSFGRIKQKKGCGCQRRQHFLNRKFPYGRRK